MILSLQGMIVAVVVYFDVADDDAVADVPSFVLVDDVKNSIVVAELLLPIMTLCLL